MRVAVIGATGKTGRYLVSRLCQERYDVVAIGRDRARLATVDACAEKRQADVRVAATIAPALADADCIVSLAHASLTEYLLGAVPARCQWLVLTGSVRRSTSLPDPAADAVRRGEAAFRAWLDRGGRGTMLHPSMVYGAREDRNVGRLLRFLARWPRLMPVTIPLPDGGRQTVQPVYFQDFVDALAAAVERRALPPAIEIVGPEPLSYRELVRQSAAALGRRAWIVPLPLAPLGWACAALSALGIKLPFTVAELRRGTESKHFAVEPMRGALGVQPRSFSEGVREKVSQGWF